MTIDEVIKRIKEKYEFFKKTTNVSYALELEHIAEWMEELKSIKENSISKETFEKMKSKAYKKGYRQGYNKAIDDFVKMAKELKYEDGELSDIDLDYIAGFLKKGE